MAQMSKDQLAVASAMKMIEASVMKLAPHPDNPAHRGFIYARSDARASGGGAQDGMLGSLIAEQIVGMAFGGMMPSCLDGIDVTNVIDAADEFYVDRSQSAPARKRAFHMSFDAAVMDSKHSAYEAAFMRDLPRRVQLERQYIQLSRRLDKMMSPEMQLKPELRHDPRFRQEAMLSA